MHLYGNERRFAGAVHGDAGSEGIVGVAGLSLARKDFDCEGVSEPEGEV